MKRYPFKVAGPMLVVAVLGIAVWVNAGDLNPPSGPVAPTMKTLDQVEPRIPISSVPYTISASGSYYLTGDLQVDPATPADGITVQADNVTINLMGYSLVGPGSTSGTNYGIYMNARSNVEIRNGTVMAFGTDGIHEPDYNQGKGHRVISVRVLENGDRGMYLRGFGHLVKDCTASENGSYGIYVGDGSVVINTTASWNQGTGIFAEEGSTVIGNTAYKNQGSIGIALNQASTVINNTAYYNQEHGIYASGGCTLIGNTAYLNNQSNTTYRAGIYVGDGCLLKDNTASANMRSNIHVSGSDNAVEENLVTDCNGNGIYFNSAGNFYANNRASGNTTNYGGSVPTGAGDGGGNAQF